MLIYLAAPYSKVADKDAFMNKLMKFSGRYMMQHPGEHIVSPLFNHFSLNHVPEMGSDWDFWKNYSEDLLKNCQELLVFTETGWQESTGVQAEILLAKTYKLPVRYTSAV